MDNQPQPEEEKSLLVCKLVENLAPKEAARTNSTKVACEFCARIVWVVPRNLILKEEKGAQIACTECAKRIAQEEMAKGEQIFEQPARPVVDKIIRKKEKSENA